MTDTAKWADVLWDAESSRRATDPITDAEPTLRIDEAYAIQAEVLARRLARGERIVGAKLGLTSRAKQEQMNVREPIYGWLTDAMALPSDAPLSCSEVIHPRVEPEIAFHLQTDLAGPGVTAADVVAATGAVCCALEIIDSRFADFRFTAADVIADNTSACRFVVSPVSLAPTFDLGLVGCVLERNGEIVDTAAGAAVLGHPANAVAHLANALGARGLALERGWLVLSGGMTAAVPLEPGTHVSAAFGRGLGSVGIRAVP